MPHGAAKAHVAGPHGGAWLTVKMSSGHAAPVEDTQNSEGASLHSAPSKIVCLWLQGNPIGAEGLSWLTPALAACPTLQTLQLAHIGLDVAAVQEVAAFASMLTAHEEMTKVDLFGNLVGKADSAVASEKQWHCGSRTLKMKSASACRGCSCTGAPGSTAGKAQAHSVTGDLPHQPPTDEADCIRAGCSCCCQQEEALSEEES